MNSFGISRAGINLFNPQKILFFLWLFLLVFPKGGFKLGGVPLTWGYFLLLATCFFAFFRKEWKIQLPRSEVLLGLLPFQVVSFFTLAINGQESLGMTLSFVVGFFVLPLLFFFIFSNDIETLDLSRFFKLFRIGIAFIASYGIFLFFYKHFTGKFIEIPFLTMNWNDLGELETKNINRGFVFKLISTYNNGNIFGVCLLMLLPLYCYLERSSSLQLVVKSALFLTFSRTVWIGLLFHECCFSFFISKNKKQALIKLFSSFIFLVLAMWALALYFDLPLTFFFDRNLGGRSEQLEFLQNPFLFSSKSFSQIVEIVYLGIIDSFGIVGLITFLLATWGNIFFISINRDLTRLRKCILLGLVNYLLMCFSDGALLFIPTLVFFWFLLSLLARKNLEFEPHQII